MSDSFSLKAGGDILPSRFIKISADYTAVAATAETDLVFGISHDSTKAAPADGLASDKHAEAGDHVSYYKLGDSCLLELGGTVAAGGLIEPGAAGVGVAAAGANTLAGAVALEGGVSGELIRVQILQVRM
jgi:hypothetical protein